MNKLHYEGHQDFTSNLVTVYLSSHMCQHGQLKLANTEGKKTGKGKNLKLTFLKLTLLSLRD